MYDNTAKHKGIHDIANECQSKNHNVQPRGLERQRQMHCSRGFPLETLGGTPPASAPTPCDDWT